MKQLLYILLGITLFTSCSSDDDPVLPEPTQDYTSFTVACETDNFTVRNCVVGYKGDNGVWVRVAALGDINGKTESKEIKVDYSKVKEVYMFQDYYENGVYKEVLKAKIPFTLKENSKNKILISNDYSVDTVNKDDPNQYPQK